MAYTANTGFRYYKSIDANASDPIPLMIKMANSASARIGDLCRINTGGFIVPAASGEVLLGVITGFVDQDGKNVLGAGIENKTGHTASGDDGVTTASDNQTRGKFIQAQVIVDFGGDILWKNKADGALAQTNLFQFFDVATGRQVTVGSASDSNGQVQLVQLDPDSTGGADADSTQGLFRLNETITNAGVDTGTAKIAA